MGGGLSPSGVTFNFIDVSTASVGEFSKKMLCVFKGLQTSYHIYFKFPSMGSPCEITQSAEYGRTRRVLVHADLTTCTTCNTICCTRTVADPGEGPSPPLFLDQTEGRRTQKIFLGDRPSLPPPPYLKVWIRHCRIRVYVHREAKY